MTLKAKQKIILILPILTLVFVVCLPVLALTVSETGIETTAGEAELPEADFTVVIGRIIGAAFSLIGIIFFLLLLYGGFLWMTSRGNDEIVKKAKDLITSSVIGLIIVIAGYAISTFVIALLIGGTTEAPPIP